MKKSKYKKILIIPYFGRFPKYFQLFLNSCEYNKGFNWLIFTDDKTEYNYPNNVKIVYMKFDELKNYFEERLNFKINLERPYKLCDYKVAYGFIFKDYIEEYDFWGYCDLDLIFGDLDVFITDEILEKYNKIFIFGHLTLYKNLESINTLFMTTYKNEEIYKKYFLSNLNYGFDELYAKDKDIRINDIFLSKGVEIYVENFAANIYGSTSKFKIIGGYDLVNKNDIFEDEIIGEILFLYENGKIKKYFIENNELKNKEYIYIHLQYRDMKVQEGIENKYIYKIIPNSFENLEYNLCLENWYKIKKSRINFQGLKMFIKFGIKRYIPNNIKKYLKTKLKNKT